MGLIVNKILSDDKKFPFSNSVEKFFDLYEIDDGVESYHFYPWPMECSKGTCVEDLGKIKYKSRIIFWCPMDSFFDAQGPFNFYTQKKTREIEKIERICKLHPDKFFILLPNFYNLNNFLSVNNLFSVDNMINTNFQKKYRRCDKKLFGHKLWTCLNCRNAPHRVSLLCYLISKNLDKTGLITCNETFFNIDNLKNIFKYFKFKKEDRKNLIKSFVKLRTRKFEKLEIAPYVRKDELSLNIDNYHQNLIPIYEQTVIEIITCTLFSEPTPLFGEKEIQSVYAKNFPIFIGSKGTAKIFKEVWGMDIFEDIVNHDYDDIDDPSERMKHAIDTNIHLLDGSVDIKTIWMQNKNRFENNCDQMDRILYDKEYQYLFDHEKIKSGLDHFNIKYKKIISLSKI